MGLLNSVIRICIQNIRKWKTDYRVWIIGLMTFIMIQVYIEDVQRIVNGLELPMTIWLFPFLYSQFHMKLIYTLPVVLLFCNAPFIDGNQTFVYLRSGRSKWLCGQMLYVAAASGIYYLFLLIVSLLSAIAAGGNLSFEWGKALSIIANTNAALTFGSPFVDISSTVITYFSPLSAVWFTFLLSWLCGTMVGLIIFFFNILTGKIFVGMAVSSILVVLSAFIANNSNYLLIGQLMPFSPISWSTLNNVDVGGITQNPSFAYCITVYLTAITLLAAGILIFGRTQSIDTKGQ